MNERARREIWRAATTSQRNEGIFFFFVFFSFRHRHLKWKKTQQVEVEWSSTGRRRRRSKVCVGVDDVVVIVIKMIFIIIFCYFHSFEFRSSLSPTLILVQLSLPVFIQRVSATFAGIFASSPPSPHPTLALSALISKVVLTTRFSPFHWFFHFSFTFFLCCCCCSVLREHPESPQQTTQQQQQQDDEESEWKVSGEREREKKQILEMKIGSSFVSSMVVVNGYCYVEYILKIVQDDDDEERRKKMTTLTLMRFSLPLSCVIIILKRIERDYCWLLKKKKKKSARRRWAKTKHFVRTFRSIDMECWAHKRNPANPKSFAGRENKICIRNITIFFVISSQESYNFKSNKTQNEMSFFYYFSGNQTLFTFVIYELLPNDMSPKKHAETTSSLASSQMRQDWMMISDYIHFFMTTGALLEGKLSLVISLSIFHSLSLPSDSQLRGTWKMWKFQRMKTLRLLSYVRGYTRYHSLD